MFNNMIKLIEEKTKNIQAKNPQSGSEVEEKLSSVQMTMR